MSENLVAVGETQINKQFPRRKGYSRRKFVKLRKIKRNNLFGIKKELTSLFSSSPLYLQSAILSNNDLRLETRLNNKIVKQVGSNKLK